MRKLFLLLAVGFSASAQTAADNPQVASAKSLSDLIKSNILRSADKMPEDKFAFRPTPDVRTYAQMLSHVADAQYLFCGIAKEGKPESRGIEKSGLTKKADISAALRDAFAYCDAVYAGLTDAGSAAPVNVFGQQRTKLGTLSFNTAHNFEHYGNLVTYLRINGIVPPSSEGAPPAPPKK